MLDSIRKQQNNLLYSLIILAVVAVMGFYGIGQLASPKTGGGDAAAWVNGDIITRREFQEELDRRLYQYRAMLGGQFDEKFLEQFQVPQRTLNELIQFKLLSQQASKMDIAVTDYELADHIRTLPYLQKDGKFDAEAYNKIPNRGLEEESQREQLKVMKFQNYLSQRFQFTPSELRKAYDVKETKVDLSYAKIDFADLAKKQKPSSGQVDDFLKASTKDIETYYNAHKKDFSEPAGVFLRQIRVSIPYQAAATQKEDARKKIDAVAKEVKADNFAQIAKTKSDDEYAKKGGEVGWVNRGTLETALETALNRLEAGQVSEPIETTFGYFILKVEKKRDAVAHSLSDVKRTIAEKLVAEKSVKSFAEQKKKEWEAMLASGKPLDAELKKFGIETKKTGPFSIAQGNIPNIGSVDSVMAGVLQLNKENPLPKTLFPAQEQYYYVKLLTVDYPKPADFPKNQETVEKNLATTYESEVVKDLVSRLEKSASIKIEIPFKQAAPTAVE
jgi:peptidyl-prolyl cis-trans isomerase D